jgi:hypothetical protein
MADPENLARNIGYRGHWLRVSRLAKQWQIEIAPTPSNPNAQILKGWDEDEILRRAKIRVDDMLEGGHS